MTEDQKQAIALALEALVRSSGGNITWYDIALRSSELLEKRVNESVVAALSHLKMPELAYAKDVSHAHAFPEPVTSATVTQPPAPAAAITHGTKSTSRTKRPR